MRRTLSADMVEGPGALDAEAIAQVADEAWPLVRDADELHDALLTLVTLPPTPEWEEFFAELSQTGRATTLQVPGGVLEPTRAPEGAVQPTDNLRAPISGASFWVAAERLAPATAAYPESVLSPPIAAVTPSRPIPDSREGCVAEILRGWLDSIGPTTADDFAKRLGLPTTRRRRWTPPSRNRRTSLAGPLLAGARRQRNRMVQPPPAGSYSPAHPGPSAPRDRAGDERRFHAIPVPLAACRLRHPLIRRGRCLANRQTASGLRGIGRRLGIADLAPPHRRLQAGTARPLVAFGRSHLGTAIAAPGLRFERPAG